MLNLARIHEAIETGLTGEAAVIKVRNDTRVRFRQHTDPYLRERLHDQPLPAAAKHLADLWRPWFEEKAGKLLFDLAKKVEDQEAFGKLIREMIEDFDIEDEDIEEGDDSEAEASPDSTESSDSDESGAAQSGEQMDGDSSAEAELGDDAEWIDRLASAVDEASSRF